ncbi:hypothetical protein DVJ77_16645 [Dyella tabacisoli]|uniref:Uncharacterized protein n=1 Tax=Dyella tabacisoli TaxID=2282381 RepID=A0A369UIY7_9GAMM|nr:hypothetical protein DVJ77_16645 [Dyella tabacisoli]
MKGVGEPAATGQRDADVGQGFKLGNGERGTGNGERGTGNGERGTGNGERGTGNGERGTGKSLKSRSEKAREKQRQSQKERGSAISLQTSCSPFPIPHSPLSTHSNQIKLANRPLRAPSRR